jgi:hypothetical protein
MKKFFFFFLTMCINTIPSFSQDHPQLRLRLGVNKPIVSAGRSQDNTLYRMYDRGLRPSGIGLEFSKPLKKPYTRFFAGAFFNFNGFSVGINPEKFSQAPAAGTFLSDYGATSFYAGFEKRIGKRKLAPNRDYISIVGGVGLSYNSPGAGPDEWFGGSIGDGITNEGKYFQGIYKDNPYNPVFSGYMTAIRRNRAHILTPEIFGGFRWPIHNKKGIRVVEIELIVNYGLNAKYYLDMPYTLDGQYQMDRLKDKGVNIQLNVLIPLKNFGKRKSEKKN